MKKVLVTGGNKGIGKAVCQLLLEKYPDVHVLLGSRDSDRGHQAVQDLIQELGEDTCLGRLETIQIDVASDESVQTAAASVKGTLYGIINNAAVYDDDPTFMVNVNYFGVRRVTDAFLPKLQRPGGRIVNVGSAAGPMFVSSCQNAEWATKLNEPWTITGVVTELDQYAKDLANCGGDGSKRNYYCFSKALLSAYTWIVAKQHEPEVIIHCITPGFIKTDLTESAKLGATNPPSKGAVPLVWLLLSDEVNHVPTGRYYGSDCKRSPWNVYREPGDPEYEGPDGK